MLEQGAESAQALTSMLCSRHPHARMPEQSGRLYSGVLERAQAAKVLECARTTKTPELSGADYARYRCYARV